MANKCIKCNNCGHVGWSKNRGNFLITIVLLIFFFVPGVIYEIWRRSGLGGCENCGSGVVVPSNQCDIRKKAFQLDISGILLVLAGLIGGFLLLSFVVTSLSRFYGETFNPTSDQLYQKCFTDGLKYYQSVKQYPVLDDGKTLTMDRLEVDCKNSKNGKFKAP